MQSQVAQPRCALFSFSFPNLPDFFQSLGEKFLAAFGGRLIPGASREAGREAIHVGDAILHVVCVLVALAVSDGLHQNRGSVAKMERNGLGTSGFDVGENLAISGVERVGFGRKGEIHSGFGEGQIAIR